MKPLLSLLFVFTLLIACKDDDPVDQPAELYVPDILYNVDVIDTLTVTDPSRNRTFPISLRIPGGKTGSLPLMIFSHGGGAAPNGHLHYSSWGNTLAKAGYLVIHIAHVDDVYNAHCEPLNIPPDECEILDFFPEVAEGGTLAVLWYNRPRDATAVLNALDDIEQATGIVIDRDRMGIIGHSGGSHTVLSAAGSVLDYSPSVHDIMYQENRLKVFVANSPQGIGRLGLDENSWSGIAAPVLVTTGTDDVTQGEDALSRRDPFAHMTGPDKFELYIDSPDASHDVFGLGGSDPTLNELEQYVSSTVVAFLDAYLLNDQEAKDWLAQKDIEEVSEQIAKLSEK